MSDNRNMLPMTKENIIHENVVIRNPSRYAAYHID